MSHKPGQPPPYLTAALRHLRSTGRAMPALIRTHGRPRLARTRNAFQTLGRSIVYQQLATAAASTIYRRFLALYPGKRFPTPARLLATPMDRLRAAGLSRGKALSLLDLASHFADGRVAPRRFRGATDEEIADMLLPVRGIGPWSVDMFLVFGLNRPDVLPVGDLGVRKGMQLYFGTRALPKPDRMEKLARPWRPYRSVASWYMYRVVEEGMP